MAQTIRKFVKMYAALAVLACFCVDSSAQLSDSDALSRIVPGSKIIVSPYLPIVPNQTYDAILGPKESSAVSDGGLESRFHCFIQAKEATPYDRGIRAGTKLAVTKISVRWSSVSDEGRHDIATHIDVDADYLDGISCWITNSSLHEGITIGEFREFTNGVLKLELAPPVVLGNADPAPLPSPIANPQVKKAVSAMSTKIKTLRNPFPSGYGWEPGPQP